MEFVLFSDFLYIFLLIESSVFHSACANVFYIQLPSYFCNVRIIYILVHRPFFKYIFQRCLKRYSMEYFALYLQTKVLNVALSYLLLLLFYIYSDVITVYEMRIVCSSQLLIKFVFLLSLRNPVLQKIYTSSLDQETNIPHALCKQKITFFLYGHVLGTRKI